jgi:CRP-like cAMP-binding protein
LRLPWRSGILCRNVGLPLPVAVGFIRKLQMLNPVQSLERFVSLSSEEKLEIHLAMSQPRHVPSGHDFVRQDEPLAEVVMILTGVACRYAVLPDGRRQILAYLLPGDICDRGGYTTQRMDHSVGTLSAVRFATIGGARFAALVSRSPGLARALAAKADCDKATARQWLLNLGHRSARARTAHLLCEVFTRLQAAALTSERSCELPLRQADLADALALSAVQVNRTLMELRRERLATFQNRTLVIHDWEAFRAVAGFDPRYLEEVGQRPLRSISLTRAPGGLAAPDRAVAAGEHHHPASMADSGE